jgi:hypothetical protein
MAKKKVTWYIDEDVLRSTRVAAAREGTRDSEAVEAALREYSLLGLLERVWARSDLTEHEAMKLAYDELHAMRAERDRE